MLKLLLLYVTFFSLSSFSQQIFNKEISQYVRQTWQTEDGLPNNSITSITQTPDGYLWFGSNSGLIRFDGVRFVSFNSSNTKGLQGDDIWCLKTDSKGRMWIGTNGTGLICYEKGKFKTYTTEDGLSENAVWTINEDSKGNIWIGTGGGGISVFNGKGFEVIDTSDGLSNNYIWTIIEDENDNMWIGTDGGYINRITSDGITIFNESRGYTGSYTMAGCSGKNNTLWFGAAGVGLINYKNGKFKTYTISDGLANDIIWSIFEDNKNNIWIGTEDGISKISGGKFNSFKEKDGLQSNAVSALYEDFEGNIWVGVKGGGITMFKDGSLTTFSKQQGISNNNVYSVLSDRNGNLWFCTGKGLNLMQSDGSFKSFSAEEGLTADIILSICDGKDGRIWVGSDGGGVYGYHNGRFIQIDLRDFVPSNTILSLYEDKKGTLWMGTDGYGVVSLTDGRLDWWTMGNGLSGEFISCIYEDSRGRIWAGTSDGTGLNEILDDTVKFYTVKDGLIANDIWSINEDNEKAIWITTPKGINKIKDGKIYSYSEKQGLPNVLFYSVVDDNLGNLWMSSNSGIFRISKAEILELDKGTKSKLNVLALGTSDGMKSSQCNRGFPSAAKTKNGLLWFPSIKGAVMVNPAKLNLNNKKPNVIIEGIKINGEYNTGANLLQPGSRDMEFYFTVLSYSSIEKVQFKYMLEGWDKEWINSGSRRSAYYTNLPPGIYQFKVIARNDADIWNTKGAFYIFEILPHFYETVWFYLLITVFTAAGIYGIFRIRMSQLKKNKILLENKVQERTKELENTNYILNSEITERKTIEKALQSSLSEKEVMLKEIHHRVKNNLQVISSLLYLNSRKIKDKEAQNVFKESQNRVKSIALVHERLYQCKNLDEIDFCDYVTRLTNELFRTYAGKHDSVKIRLDIKNIFINIDTAVPCALIINEVVSNSFKYAFPSNRKFKENFIDIRIKRTDTNQLILEISDNGIGLPQDLEEKKKNSLGMQLIESLVNQLDGTIEYVKGPGTMLKMVLKG